MATGYNGSLASRLATAIDAYKRCAAARNEFAEAHLRAIRYYEKEFLSGGRIACAVNIDQSSTREICLNVDVAIYNDVGYFDGYRQFEIDVIADFVYGMDFRIRSDDNDDDLLEDYLAETIGDILDTPIDDAQYRRAYGVAA